MDSIIILLNKKLIYLFFDFIIFGLSLPNLTNFVY